MMQFSSDYYASKDDLEMIESFYKVKPLSNREMMAIMNDV